MNLVKSHDIFDLNPLVSMVSLSGTAQIGGTTSSQQLAGASGYGNILRVAQSSSFKCIQQ